MKNSSPALGLNVRPISNLLSLNAKIHLVQRSTLALVMQCRGHSLPLFPKILWVDHFPRWAPSGCRPPHQPQTKFQIKTYSPAAGFQNVSESTRLQWTRKGGDDVTVEGAERHSHTGPASRKRKNGCFYSRILQNRRCTHYVYKPPRCVLFRLINLETEERIWNFTSLEDGIIPVFPIERSILLVEFHKQIRDYGAAC